MEVKNVRINAEIHEKLVQECKRQNIKISEFAELCINYFIDEKVDPRKPNALKEVRDTFVTFIRTQEKTFHLPQKEFNKLLTGEIDEISHNVLSVKADLKVIKQDIEHIIKSKK